MTDIKFANDRSYTTGEIAKQIVRDFPDENARYLQSAISTWFNKMSIPSQNGQAHHKLFAGEDCQRCYEHFYNQKFKKYDDSNKPDILDAAASFFGFKDLSKTFVDALEPSENKTESDKKRDRFNIQITDRPDLKQKITDFRYSKRLGFAKAAVLILDTYFEEHPLDTFEDKVSKMSRDELAELVMKNRSAFDDRFYI